ncbi:MAG: DNA polymerase III subunit beta [Bacteroidales bacterium]|nr:DNA polymerase III subunit beta [Bacteroidales bacterium]
MKFIVNSQIFNKQLQAMSGVLANNNTVPIINCFHFQIEENILTVRATDLETTLVTKIELESGRSEGLDQVAVPSKLLLDILKNLDDVPMTFTLNPNNFAIEIASGDGKYSLAGQNAESFPIVPVIEDSAKAIIPASVLVNCISKTSFACSNDEMRQQMSGIFMKFSTENLTVVATDAHKLVRYRNSEVQADQDVEFILPRKPITLIKNIIASYKDDFPVTVEYNKTNVSFSFDNFFAVCRLVEGKYPNIEAAIPKENPNKLIVDRISFLNTLRRVSIFANKSTHQVRLAMDGAVLEVSAEDIEFSNVAHEKIGCEYQGSPMEIGFNARFLMEMVNNMETERIIIEMSQPTRAGIIFPYYEEENDSKEDILMLVMPVMLAN